MSKPLIRFVRLHCSCAGSHPQRGKDGVVAVAAINENAGLARLLLADMGRWKRNQGVSVRNAIKAMSMEAHRTLIAGFAIPFEETQVVEMDQSGNFDLWCDFGDGLGRRRAPLAGFSTGTTPRSGEAFMEWAGPGGAEMLRVAERIGLGEWAGVEG
jgi:hypothetical protein